MADVDFAEGPAPQGFRLGSESRLTYRLKWEAWEWLYHEAQCRCVGLEVRLQGPWGAVVDVVGVGPGNTVYVVEVKASRSDFARDNHTPADIARLHRRADALARRIELADGSGLPFPERRPAATGTGGGTTAGPAGQGLHQVS